MDALPEVDEDKTGNSSDEELWGFFENMDKASPDTIVQTDKTDILVRFVFCSLVRMHYMSYFRDETYKDKN